MVEVDQRQMADTTARQRLRAPRADATDPDNCDTGLADTCCRANAEQSLQAAETTRQIGVVVSGNVRYIHEGTSGEREANADPASTKSGASTEPGETLFAGLGGFRLRISLAQFV